MTTPSSLVLFSIIILGLNLLFRFSSFRLKKKLPFSILSFQCIHSLSHLFILLFFANLLSSSLRSFLFRFSHFSFCLWRYFGGEGKHLLFRPLPPHQARKRASTSRQMLPALLMQASLTLLGVTFHQFHPLVYPPSLLILPRSPYVPSTLLSLLASTRGSSPLRLTSRFNNRRGLKRRCRRRQHRLIPLHRRFLLIGSIFSTRKSKRESLCIPQEERSMTTR